MSTNATTTTEQQAAQDSVAVSSAVLTRLIEEVRNNQASAPTAYNRMHNRHNR